MVDATIQHSSDLRNVRIVFVAGLFIVVDANGIPFAKQNITHQMSQSFVTSHFAFRASRDQADASFSSSCVTDWATNRKLCFV